MAVMNLFRCLFSPRLMKFHDDRRTEDLYEPRNLEKWGDQIIHSLFLMWNVGVYTSPLVVGMLYKRGYFVLDGMFTIGKFLTGLGLVLVASFYMRAYGRASNPMYTTFLTHLNAAKTDLNKDTKKLLAKYDFEFYAWPVEFRWDDALNAGDKKPLQTDRHISRRSFFENLFGFPCWAVGYLLAHTVGLAMVYPGSISVLQYAMSKFILQGRIKLVNEFAGERFKLRTQDGNDIDSMFVDRRNKHENGSILVICSEGNAGFYEIGIMITPILGNFSVLGWNHPGFGGSTGKPYPPQEHNAVETVMQFAIHRLGFQPENILLFGWSIGGYSTAYAAMRYPDVRGLVLDATFDDILPLAIPRMPRSFEPLVRKTIRDHINLNISSLILKYPGPILIIRRTEDEVICTEEQQLATNRGNYLLIKLLRFRYPNLFDDERVFLVNRWLSVDVNKQNAFLQERHIDENACLSELTKYAVENDGSFPSEIGSLFSEKMKNDMALFLARKYMVDFRSTHCTPLPPNLFQLPWEISPDSDYVRI